MNVYDFDRTIYRKDSSFDFYLFCLSRHTKILRHLPAQASAFVRHYLFRSITKTQMKEIFYRYFRDIPDMKEEIDLFWRSNIRKIEPYFLKRQRIDDVIISASPTFLLHRVSRMLGVRYLIASEVDEKTGKYLGENCYGAEKVRRFFERFPDGKIEEFYSDSLSDSPLAELAEVAYLVVDSHCEPWPTEKKSL